MNKMRKLSALVCAGALAVTAVAPAWAGTLTSGDIASEGGLENMGENGVSIDSIVLPTMAEGSYDFTVDPEKLLRSYGGAANYDDKTLFFNAQDDAAKLEATTTGTNVYYEDKRALDIAGADAATAKAAFKLNSSNDAVEGIATADKYFVWVPDRSSDEAISKAAGKWVTLTDANYATYFNVTVASNAVSAVTPKGDKDLDLEATTPNVCDGKLYMLDKIQIQSTDDLTKFVTPGETKADGTAPITIKDGVKLSTGATAAAATDVTAANVATALKYTAATRTNTNVSDEVKIVNKSSADKTVKVKVNVTNGAGLNFVQGTATGAGTDPTEDNLDKTKASLFLKISGTDGVGSGTAKSAYVKKDTVGTGDAAVDYYSASLEFDVDGLDLTATGSPVTTYMAGKDDKTNGHKFNAFLSPVKDSEYKSVSFTLSGAAANVAGMLDSTSTEKTAKAAAQKVWNDYAATLRRAETPVNPGITVVYEIKDRVTKLAGTPVATSGEASWDGGYIWFGLADTVKATDATEIQIVNKTGVIEDVYKVNLSDCSLDGSWIGLPSGQEAGDTSTVLVKVGTTVYSQKLW